MTKAELVETMAKDAKISKAAAGAALDFFMANVTNALKKKGSWNPSPVVCHGTYCDGARYVMTHAVFD